MKLPKIITVYEMYLKEQETEPVFITAFEMYQTQLNKTGGKTNGI